MVTIMRKKLKLTRILGVLFALLVVFWSVAPIIWIFMTGIKDPDEVYQMPPTIWPETATFENIKAVFQERPFAAYIRNSAIVALSTVLISSFLGITAGYGFSKFRFGGKALLLGLILLTRTIPPPSLLVPFYTIAKYFGLINTHFVLIMCYVYIALPLNIWIIRGFFDSFPNELIDAAEIDGCSRIGALCTVVVPNILPAAIAIAIISFMLAWNELLYGVVFTTTPYARTLSPGITDFFGDFHIFWSHLSAAAFIAIIPAILFTLLFSRHMVSGLVEGAVKG